MPSVCESPTSHRLQPQSHLHATYRGGSICESGLSVNDSHRVQPQSHHHATSSFGSICKSDLSVHNSHRLKAQSYVHAIYMLLISSMEIALCLQSVAVVDRQATFTDTSTDISSMEVALHIHPAHYTHVV